MGKKLRHKPFNKHVRKRSEPIRKLFGKYDKARDRDDWEYGFRCDANPWKELAVWALMADTYRELEKEVPSTSHPQLYLAILTCSQNGHLAPTLHEDTKKVINAYRVEAIYQKHLEASGQKYVDEFRTMFPDVPDE